MRPLTMCCLRKSDHAVQGSEDRRRHGFRRQPGEALMSVVLVEDENGNETSLRHDDGLLYERYINEGDLVTIDGQHQLWKL